MNRIVGTPLYKKITIRSANTMRKLSELTATYTAAGSTGATKEVRPRLTTAVP